MKIIVIPLLILLSVGLVAGQNARGPFVLELNTQLVIRTVSVTNNSGEAVSGLTPQDFRVFEDGVLQTISVFEFQEIDDTPLPAIDSLPDGPADAGQFGLQRATFRLGAIGSGQHDGRRLLAFYFDPGGMSQSDWIRALDAARTFVRTQMTAGDLVAVLIFTDDTAELVQDFTEDRHQLLAAIQSFRHRGGNDELAAVADLGRTPQEFDVFATDRRLVALEATTRALGNLRGAKALIYFSGGMDLSIVNQAQLTSTLNSAVRSNVSIFPVDARGLSAFAPLGNANERSAAGTAIYTVAGAMNRMSAFQRSQDLLFTLAADTGGSALLNSNDLVTGIVEAQSATSGHYVIAYYPRNTSEDGSRRTVRIELNRESGNLSYQNSYYARKDFSHYSPADKERQLQEALMLEDPITDFTIAVETHYFRLNETHYFVPVAMRIPGNELMPARQAGAESAIIDFIGEIEDASGARIASLRDQVEISLADGGDALIASSPIQYDTGFTLSPGNHTLKLLARNVATGRIGTYQRTLIVPDLEHDAPPLPISSVVLGTHRVDTGDTLFDASRNDEGSVNPLIQNGQKLIPNIGHVFSTSQPLNLYVEAYGTPTLTGRTLVGFVTLYAGEKRVFETPPATFREPGGNPGEVVPIDLTVPPNQLPTGEYTCLVTILHPDEGTFASWQTQILVVP